VIREAEHVLRPGSFRGFGTVAALEPLQVRIGEPGRGGRLHGDRGILRLRGARAAERVAALHRQGEHLEHEQTRHRDQDDRDQPELAREQDHAATLPARWRMRAAKACAAETVD
jgi:hypothetical protein